MARKQIAHRQRAIQKQVAKAEKTRPKKKNDRALQAEARPYPAPPFPRQHQPKPGSESKLKPPLLYDAPFDIGSKRLMDKVALITAGDSGFGRAGPLVGNRRADGWRKADPGGWHARRL